MATFSEVHTARKRHVPGCSVCCKAIRPGQRYSRFAATPYDEIWDGEGWTHLKAHEPYGDCLDYEPGQSPTDAPAVAQRVGRGEVTR